MTATVSAYESVKYECMRKRATSTRSLSIEAIENSSRAPHKQARASTRLNPNMAMTNNEQNAGPTGRRSRKLDRVKVSEIGSAEKIAMVSVVVQ